MNNYFFTNSDTVYMYVTCRKDDSTTSNEIWSERYKAAQSAIQQSVLSKNDRFMDYSDWTVLDFLNYAITTEDEDWIISTIQLTNEQIQNGIGNFNFKSLFSDFFSANGDGDYLIQIFFSDNSSPKIFSLPSDILKVSITDTNTPTPETTIPTQETIPPTPPLS